ncbi:hypothetical protein ACL02T_25435 [Pseudonocardia sp. RS010]|uniref:hypothetical protein n=1 Tax=Pseudonocardia sp. RS010 TaxID=3385979 RepID=UPI00399F8C91
MRFRRAALALVAAAGLAGLAGCAISGPTPLCDQARALVDQGQLAQAAELFARAQVRAEGQCAQNGLDEVGDRYAMAYEDAARGAAAEIEGRTDIARSAYESALRLDAGNQAASNGLVRLDLPAAERSSPLPLPAVAPYPQARWWTGWQLAVPALVLGLLAVAGVAALWRRGGSVRYDEPDGAGPNPPGRRPGRAGAGWLGWGRGRTDRRASSAARDAEPWDEVGPSADGDPAWDEEWSGGDERVRGGEPGGGEGRGRDAGGGSGGRPGLARGGATPEPRAGRSWLQGRDLGRGTARRGSRRSTPAEADARWDQARAGAQDEREPAAVLPPGSRPLPAASGAAAAVGVLGAGEVAAESRETDSTTRRPDEPIPRREVEPSPPQQAEPPPQKAQPTPQEPPPQEVAEPSPQQRAHPSEPSEAEQPASDDAEPTDAGTVTAGSREAPPSAEPEPEPEPERGRADPVEGRTDEPPAAESGGGGPDPAESGRTPSQARDVEPRGAEPPRSGGRTVASTIPGPDPTLSDDEPVEERAAAEAPAVPAAKPEPALRAQLADLDLEVGQLQRILNRSLRTDRDGGPPRFFATREPVKGPAVAVTLAIVALQLTGGGHTGTTLCIRRTVSAERQPGPWVPEARDDRWQDVAEEVDHRLPGTINDSDGRMWITPGRDELRGVLLDLNRIRPAWLPLLHGDDPSTSVPLTAPPPDQVTGLRTAFDGAQPLVSPQPLPSGIRLLAIVDALLAGPALTNVRVDAVANEVLALATAESVEHALDDHLLALGR